MNVLRLKEFREKAKLSQKKIGELMGVTQQTYSRWELGLRFPNPIEIKKLCEIFKCTPNDLFGFKGVHAVTSKEVL
jgi:transcriptional regulator with XRE-family HTH domain